MTSEATLTKRRRLFNFGVAGMKGLGGNYDEAIRYYDEQYGRGNYSVYLPYMGRNVREYDDLAASYTAVFSSFGPPPGPPYIPWNVTVENYWRAMVGSALGLYWIPPQGKIPDWRLMQPANDSVKAEAIREGYRPGSGNTGEGVAYIPQPGQTISLPIDAHPGDVISIGPSTTVTIGTQYPPGSLITITPGGGAIVTQPPQTVQPIQTVQPAQPVITNPNGGNTNVPYTNSGAVGQSQNGGSGIVSKDTLIAFGVIVGAFFLFTRR